jgi:hypothetical protein
MAEVVSVRGSQRKIGFGRLFGNQVVSSGTLTAGAGGLRVGTGQEAGQVTKGAKAHDTAPFWHQRGGIFPPWSVRSLMSSQRKGIHRSDGLMKHRVQRWTRVDTHFRLEPGCVRRFGVAVRPSADAAVRRRCGASGVGADAVFMRMMLYAAWVLRSVLGLHLPCISKFRKIRPLAVSG